MKYASISLFGTLISYYLPIDDNMIKMQIGMMLAGLLASMDVTYIKQVHHPVKLDIGCRITRVGSKSYDVHQGIFVEGENDPSFQTVHTFVMFNFVEQKSIPVHQVVIDNLKELE